MHTLPSRQPGVELAKNNSNNSIHTKNNNNNNSNKNNNKSTNDSNMSKNNNDNNNNKLRIESALLSDSIQLRFNLYRSSLSRGLGVSGFRV